MTGSMNILALVSMSTEMSFVRIFSLLTDIRCLEKNLVIELRKCAFTKMFQFRVRIK